LNTTNSDHGRGGPVRRGFPAVPTVPDFPGLETDVLDRWERHSVFARSVSDRAEGPEFVFFEGPPTANGRPGIHHVWARAYKDLVCRYRTMRGYRVARRAGWDTHGLPVEVEVEKRLGFTGKDQIEAYGVDRFIEACRQSVYEYVNDWEVLTRRMGYWVDLESAYWTLSPEYIESVWWHLAQIWAKGELYEDVKVVPYCPRCGTSLSSHELGQPDVYRDTEDVTAYVRLPIVGPGPDGAEALVVWTTTPWTLVSNSGVAVGAEMNYVVVDGLVVAESRAEAVLGSGALQRVTGRLTGVDLVGVRYQRPFELVPVPVGADGWRVVVADFVTEVEGSGLVHIAPAFGADDWRLGRAQGLPTLNPVGPDGAFIDAGWLTGRPVREANADIVEHLETAGLVVRSELYVHSYPHCWRCGTPLINWGKPSWYVATSRHKDELLANNETVTWRPETVKHGRFGEWLANNVDWALSRDRYWGTPLPVWRCESGHAVCIESRADLSQRTGQDLSDIDLHRPGIDAVVFACAECGGQMRRVEPVIDAWFDSGSMPAGQWGYPHVPGSQEAFRPVADYICEAVDQTRGWFYSLLAVNTLVFGHSPYRTVLCLGHLVDADGRKMSKSIGNVFDPWPVIDTRGTDPMRWWMFHQGSPWTATRTSLELIDASTADVLMTLWNTWSFFATYAQLNDFDRTDPTIPTPSQRPVLDRWLRSRLHGTVAAVTEALEDYQPLSAADAIADLVDDLSNWYVRSNRRRFWRTDPTLAATDGLAAHATLHEALVTVALLLAPFCPFLAERLWTDITGAEESDSVHLAAWPTVDRSAIDAELERSMALTRHLVSIGRASRAQAGVKVRQPLRRALIALPPDSPALLEDLVAEELNVDEVVRSDRMSELLAFDVVPNFRLLGPRLGEAVKHVRPALAQADPAALVDAVEKGATIRLEVAGETIELGPDEVEVRVRPREGFAVSREGTAAVALDLTIDETLRRRGLLRDVIRQVQSLRRDRGLAMSDRIELHLEGLDELEQDTAVIAREVLAHSVSFSRPERGEAVSVETDDGRSAAMWLARVV
jgi:isoleucyl-tRNA synthetase